MESEQSHFHLYRQVYSFPVELAAKVAVHTVNRFLQDNPDCFDLVEWVLFDAHTEELIIYQCGIIIQIIIRDFVSNIM